MTRLRHLQHENARLRKLVAERVDHVLTYHFVIDDNHGGIPKLCHRRKPPVKNLFKHAKSALVGVVPSALQPSLRRLWWQLGAEGPVIRPGVLRPVQRELHATTPLDAARLAFPGHRPADPTARLQSSLCRQGLLESPAFRYWADRLGEPWRPDRKLWEFCFVCQALYERGLLRHGSSGLGFAVGREPLPSLFASFGCDILATDLAPGDTRAAPWARSGQWLEDLNVLNERGLCDPQNFAEHVRIKSCDMNQIPPEFRGFDFTWSSCSFEHCGNLEKGLQFVLNQMQCLKPGGVAVHTTEFNLSSDDRTLSDGPTVIYRRRDMEDIVQRLRAEGHHVEPLDLELGNSRMDRTIDQPPYPQPFERKQHMRLVIGHWVATSVGLIITKKS